MKIKFIAAACMALCSSASFATPCDTTTKDAALIALNTCVPDSTLYIAGSSALGDALSAVVVADLFDKDSTITKVTDTGSSMGTTGANAVSAWFGLAADKTKNLFVVYNKQNGSAAGVSQLLSPTTDTTIPEFDVVSLTANNSCVLNPDIAAVVASSTAAAAPAFHSASCSSHARTKADMALSDVAPIELVALEGVKPAALTTIASTAIGMQGFGVAVSNDLYVAMQVAQGTSGQPSIRRADYASLVTKQGSIKSATALLGKTDATKLTLVRRDQLSGTQAASNIFFADNACGSAGLKGQLDPIRASNIMKSATSSLHDINAITESAAFTVVESATGGGVVTALNNPGYAIGVVTLASKPVATTPTWRFVKLDGVSPNFETDGITAAYKQRTAFAKGDYQFAVASFAAVPNLKAAVLPKAATLSTAQKAAIDVINNQAKVDVLAKQTLTGKVITGLKDSTLHDLAGIAYLDGATDQVNTTTPKQSLVHRTAGNNCSPLIK